MNTEAIRFITNISLYNTECMHTYIYDGMIGVAL